MRVDGPVWLLLALLAGFTAFNLFDDKPRAFYVSTALVGAAQSLVIGWQAESRRLRMVSLYGAFLFGSTAAGGILYSHLQNGWQYLFDAGTGAPVSAITWLVGVLIAGWLIGKKDG